MLNEAAVPNNIANEDSYERLVTVIEASQGMLALLIASCEPSTFQEQLTERYETELAPAIHCYQVRLNQSEPSLIAALDKLVQEHSELKSSEASAVITVTGIADLLAMTVRVTDAKSALEKFFGYLQWTREGLRAFPYPIVLWITPKILRQISMAAPDFWSWRSGVFRFTPPEIVETGAVFTSKNEETPQLILSERFSSLPIDELLEQVESIKRQNNALPALASLYDRLGQAYASRVKLKQSENLQSAIEQAISFFKQSIEIEIQLGKKSDQVNTLIRLGQLYGEIDRHYLAKEAYQQALKISRETNDRIGEAASLAGLGITYQQPVQRDNSLTVGINSLKNLSEHLEYKDEHSQIVDAYQQSLQVMPREAMPVEWADVMNNLANTYAERVQGNRAQNIEKAINAYQQVLTIRTREAMPIEWAQANYNLAITYTERIQGDRAQNIENAIAAYREALQVMTRKAMPARWAGVMNNLANAYAERVQGNRAKNIEDAIVAFQQVLQVTTRETMPERWAQVMNNLAIAYMERIQGNQAKNLEDAIEAYQQVLQVETRKAMPIKWALAKMNLAIAFNKRIRGDRAQNIEDAIDAYQQALQEITREAMPVEWAQVMTNLASAYSKRIRGDRAQNIENAIEAYEQALQVRTRDTMPDKWAISKANLATAYAERIRGEKEENIEKAIEAYQQALQIRTHENMPVEWAQIIDNLASAYFRRIRGDRASNIEQAITYYQQALTVRTQNDMPVEWALTLNNLANAYSTRVRGDRENNIEQAITYYQQALTVRTQNDMPVEWALTLNNLANAYSTRIRGDRENNIEQAITYYQQALTVRTQDDMPVEWATTQNNLAVAYKNRIQGNQVENIEQAISAYQLALEIYTLDDFPIDWAKIQNNVATAYNVRTQGDRAKNIEQAIRAYQLALQVFSHNTLPVDWATTQHNLAIAYANRIRGDRAENLKLAITSYQLALKIRTPDTFPRNCRLSAQNLGNLHFEQRNWATATTAYRIALTAAENLYQACIFLESQAVELAETAKLSRQMAYAHAREGDLSKAVEVLEQGRARRLGDSLDRNRADLEQLSQAHPDLVAQYQNITAQIHGLEIQQRTQMTSEEDPNLTSEVTRTDALRLRQTLTETIEQIRKIKGYEKFLTLPTFDDICRAVRRDSPLVYLVSTTTGSLALVVTLEGITDLWLNDLTEARLQELFNTWISTYNQFQVDRPAWPDMIEQGTRKLWHLLMAPLVTYLKQNSFQKATLIPTGFLNFFPLHAAWTEDSTAPTGRRYALDDIGFNYVPSARSLEAAYVIARHTQADSILAIDDPLKDLPNVSREVTSAISTFSQFQVLRHEKASISAVLDAFPNYNVLHLCCHGIANLRVPLSSSLVMSDGPLTLRDILAFPHSGIRLAILSADETGLPGIALPDEVVSLPSGLLQSGVAGIIAPLWSVSDFSTMMLFTRFYDLWRVDNLEIDQALCQAQKWVRDTTNGEKVIYFKESIPKPAPYKDSAFESAGGNLPVDVAEYLYRSLILAHPNARDFAHPFHWAAFSYVGV